MISRLFARGSANSTVKRTLILSLVILVSTAAICAAQSPDPPSQMLKAYRAQRTTWFTNVLPAANTLFGLLALIDFAWSAAVMVLEKQDFHAWVSALVRKMMTIGAFYALLIYGRFWIPAIVDSFEILGQKAAGTGPLDPGDVFARGLNLAGALIDGATTAGLFTNFGASLALVFAAVMCLLGFCVITIQFVVAMVESYILVAAAFVFLGFGGSRWSSPYVERYIALAVSVGVKIMLIYLLIGTGMNVSLSWLDDAERIATAAQPATSAFSIMGASVILAALCWQAPKLISGVLGGSPSFTGNDVISTVATMGAGAALLGSGVFTVGGLLASGARGVMSAAQALALGRESVATAAGVPAGVGTPKVPRAGSNGTGGNGRGNNQPSPPASNSNDSHSSTTRVTPPEFAQAIQNRFERRS
jgi:type IV secretion system protein TrbL